MRRQRSEGCCVYVSVVSYVLPWAVTGTCTAMVLHFKANTHLMMQTAQRADTH